MNQPESFEVAISFCENSDWIAKDVNSFLSEMDINSYYYKANQDITKGRLLEKIKKIYSTSSINLLIWSDEYELKNEDEIIFAEKMFLKERHITNKEFDSLIIVSHNTNNISKEFKDIIFHSLIKTGLFGIRNMIIERLRHKYSILDTNKNYIMIHPQGDFKNRDEMSFCNIHLQSDYLRTEQWKRLGDLKVLISHPTRDLYLTDIVFLIPSGMVINMLSNTKILKTQEINLDLKKKLSIEFYQKYEKIILTGFFFYRKKEGKQYPYVYCTEYDAFLNHGLINHKY